ncbi:MAG: hypothetical protein FWE66_05270, partial [Oscillospiraceae bacterium]|nr:hypothetical protein [Oscillospiraceae bacterium]
ENGEAASGTPLVSGSTVTAGTKLRINCDAHEQSGTSHKYFYTTDGTDPVPGNANTFAFNWNSNSPSVFSNPSIVVPEGSGQFVIKAMTYGYGRLQSNVVTYAYNYPVPDNAAFLTGPSEVNIDVEDGIEYVVNVAKVENINMFDIALSYDASKLTFDEIELSLPSALAAWVIPESIKNSASAGTLEFTIAGGARNEVLTSVDATSIASVKFTLKDSVKAGDELSASLTAATLYNPVNGSKHDATITGGAVLTLLTENGFDPLMYDINNDGVFDLVDLSIIIFRYFQVAQGEALWAEAALYDIMPNGVIDTADIIALYSIIISL